MCLITQKEIYNIFHPNFPQYNITDDGVPVLAAIRVGDWNYIQHTVGFSGWAEAPESGTPAPAPAPEDIRNVLYNVATDPEERENLVDLEPELAADIKAKLDKYIDELPADFYPDMDPAGRPENFGGIWSAGWC